MRRCFIAFALQLCLQYAIRRAQVNQNGFKLSGAHQLWTLLIMVIYWMEAYIL